MAIPFLAKLLAAIWHKRPVHAQPVEKDLGSTTTTSPFKIDSTPAISASAPPDSIPTTTLLPSALTLPARQCPLCLSPRGAAPESGGTCVTECGHVFCWACIQEWGHEKVGHL